VVAVILVSGVAGASIYYGNLETVPYTKRRHFVLISPTVERQLGEAQFKQLKNVLRDKILPPIHPDSIRARLISNEIISALQRGLRHHKTHWNSIEYSSHELSDTDFDPKRSPDTIVALQGGYREEHLDWPHEEEELMDDRWIHESRGKDMVKGGTPPEMRHMDGLKWEVLVVRDKMVNAFCLPGGKIVVFTGLLDHFRTDEEIATVLGHEVYPKSFLKCRERGYVF
jgi:metalloendopeptidase OMA1, mitochondrial